MEFDRNSNSGSVVIDKSYVNPLFSSTEDISLSHFEAETDSNIESNKQIKHLNTEIFKIKYEIKEIKQCLENINETMLNISGSCHNMDQHISFIDSVYSNIRKPMEFIFNKINYLSGSEQLVLEETPKN